MSEPITWGDVACFAVAYVLLDLSDKLFGWVPTVAGVALLMAVLWGRCWWLRRSGR